MNQNSGLQTVNSRGDSGPALSVLTIADAAPITHQRSEEDEEQHRQQAGGQRAPDCQPANVWHGHARAREHERADLPERDEDRVTRRVGLMLGDVEVAHAQREVDRVQILERRGQHGQMRRERNDRERADEFSRQIRLGGVGARR